MVRVSLGIKELLKTALLQLGLALLAVLTAGELLADDWQQIQPSAPFKYYTPRDGMSQADARHIAQDDYGYLWIATRRGLSRYDGSEFRTYTIGQGLPTNFLTFVYPHGRDVFIGDGRGNVSVLTNDEIRVLRRAPGAAASAVTGIAVHNSTVYIATESDGLITVARFANAAGGETLLDVTSAVRDLAIDKTTLWLVHGGSLFRQDLSQPWQPSRFMTGVTSSRFASNGDHWLLLADRRAGVRKGTSVDERYRIDGDSPLVELAVDNTGGIWVRGERNLYRAERWLATDGSDTRASRMIDNIGRLLTLFVDRENTLWVGGEGRTARYLGDRFQHYSFRSLGFNPVVWSAAGIAPDNILIGTENELLQLRDGQVRSLNDITGLPNGAVRAMVSAGQGRFYIGITEVGIYRVDANGFRASLLPGTAGTEVLALELGADGKLWVGRHDGLHVFDPLAGKFRAVDTDEQRSVYTVAAGEDGSVWYGIDGVGLGKVNATSLRREALFTGEAGFNAPEFNHIRWLAKDRIWIGGEDGRLYLFDGVTADNIGPKTSLRSDSAYLVASSADGSLIVGGAEGLYHIDPATLATYKYGFLHGFAGLESNVHAVFNDENGTLWIGTVSGLTRMDLRRPRPQTPQPVPTIMAPMVGERAGGTPVLAWDENSLTSEYAAISLLYPQDVEYSYRLEGRDENWSAATRNRHVDFSSLAPGTYQIAVRARYRDQPWSEPVTSTEFRVLAPFWRTSWFIWTGILLAAGLVPVFIKIRMRRIEATNRRLRRDVLERTRSIERAKAHLEATNRRLSKEADERRKSDLARIEVEERFRRAFESSPIGMALITPDRDVIDANPALTRLLWSENDDSEGRRSLVESFAPADRSTFEQLLSKLESGARDSAEVELRLIDANGAERDTVINLSAIRSERFAYRYSVCQVQDVTDARRMNAQLAYQANYDELTGLLNRRAFESALDTVYRDAHKQSQCSFLMFMDLDQFKIVNDTSGHAAGDELLKLVSQLIRDQVRGDDLVGRLGGDEFALLLWSCPEDVALRIAESIRVAIEEFQFNWDTETYRVGISIGVVPLDPELGDVSELQQLADAACYEAKDGGRNRVHITRTADDASQGHRGEAQWVQRLRDAMDHDRFALYGQLIKPVRPEDDERERMEILLRMRDPVSRKLIPPGAFLPASERFGLSTSLDRWVIENLIRTLYVHGAFGAGDRRYWINLSGNSVGDRRFAEFLVDAIKNSPLPEGMMNFEITETAVIRSVAEAGRLMTRLRDLGCQFALDDFGSGLSSFGYLKKLPVDYLKIDGMFVRDIQSDETDRMFVRSIIDIAHTMGIKVTTEFVENEGMLQTVANLGADFVQGYGIHRPEVLFPQFPIRAADIAAPAVPAASIRAGGMS